MRSSAPPPAVLGAGLSVASTAAPAVKTRPVASRTLVTIVEASWKPTPAGLKASYGNCAGWTQMLSALKARVEYDINLRQGAYC